MGYRSDAIALYGDKCEICGHSMTEVHHIDYQEHQKIEDYIRYLWKNGNDIVAELDQARHLGYLEWKGSQLSKDDRTTNLAVLCGNCHSLMHKLDVGKKLLKVLAERI